MWNILLTSRLAFYFPQFINLNQLFIILNRKKSRELRKVIIRARPNLSPHKKTFEPVEDPDMPPCMEWSEKQVGDWISSIGFPYLRVPLF